MEKEKIILTMTCPEFIEALRQGLGLGDNDPSTTQEMAVKKHNVYGMQGLADLLGCSLATASRIKKSGVLDPAISQKGRIIVTDADLALDLLKVSNKRVENKFCYKKS